MTIPDRPSRASLAPRLLALVGVALLVAACGATSTPVSPTGGSPAPSASAAAQPSGMPSASAAGGSPAPSAATAGSPSPQASQPPFASASPSPQPGSADACSGTAENRDFYSALADSVAWDVYCPVLPPGWFVESGSYRLANGGQLSITYQGPGGARIVIREGAYCLDPAGCSTPGTDAGSARFGNLDARLLDPGDGSWLVIVPSGTGGQTAWQASGSGMDGPTLAGYTAAFARVDQ